MQIGAKGIENIFMIILLKKNSKNKKIKKNSIPLLSIKHIWALHCCTLLTRIVIIIIIIMFSYGFQ
jgi:hypothetical protein